MSVLPAPYDASATTASTDETNECAPRVTGTPRAGALYLARIASNGDTGVARAALDWAITNGIEHGGWCPAGRRAEDGIISSSYALQEVYKNRTGPDIRSNLLGSDAMLLINLGVIDGWTHLAVQMCRRAKRPLCIVQLEDVGEIVIKRRTLMVVELSNKPLLNSEWIDSGTLS